MSAVDFQNDDGVRVVGAAFVLAFDDSIHALCCDCDGANSNYCFSRYCCLKYSCYAVDCCDDEYLSYSKDYWFDSCFDYQ
jgi:hypothetical protein